MSRTQTTPSRLAALFAAALGLTACASAAPDAATTPATAANAPAEASADSQAQPDAATILARYVEVTGGEAAYQGIERVHMRATFAIPKQNIEGKIEAFWDQGKLVMTTELPGMGVERTGGSGDAFWSTSPMTGARVLDAAEIAQLKREFDPAATVEWKTYYQSATTKGTDEVDGEAVYVVELVPLVGKPITRYYGVESGLLLRQSATVETQMGALPADSYFRDYEKYGELLAPRVSVTKVAGMEQIATTEAYEQNVAIDAAVFAVPDEVQPLLEQSN